MLKKILKQKRRLNRHLRLSWADAQLSTRTSFSFLMSSNLEFKILSCLTLNDEDSDFIVATLDAFVRVERSWQKICSLLNSDDQELDIVLIVYINFKEDNCFWIELQQDNNAYAAEKTKIMKIGCTQHIGKSVPFKWAKSKRNQNNDKLLAIVSITDHVRMSSDDTCFCTKALQSMKSADTRLTNETLKRMASRLAILSWASRRVLQVRQMNLHGQGSEARQQSCHVWRLCSLVAAEFI